MIKDMIFNLITYIIVFAALAYSVKSTYLILFKKKSKCTTCASGNLCNLKKLKDKVDF